VQMQVPAVGVMVCERCKPDDVEAACGWSDCDAPGQCGGGCAGTVLRAVGDEVKWVAGVVGAI
jgi:hypothetical protein